MCRGLRGQVAPLLKPRLALGISSRPPRGRRRTELENTGRQFLGAVQCEPAPERAGEFCTAVKLPVNSAALCWPIYGWPRRRETSVRHLVSRDSDFGGAGLALPHFSV